MIKENKWDWSPSDRNQLASILLKKKISDDETSAIIPNNYDDNLIFDNIH